MKKDTIKEVVEKLNRNYLTEELFMPKKRAEASGARGGD